MVSLGLLLVLAAVLFASILIGTTGADVQKLFHGDVNDAESRRIWTILLEYRLPRALLAALAGAGLASAGVVFQGVLRNPLADPYIIGIAGGASLGAAVSILLLKQTSVAGTSLFAFLGSLTSVGLVYGLATQKRTAGYVNTVILAGVIVGAFMNAMMLLIMSLSGSDELQRILFWLMGDLSMADYGKLRLAGAITLSTWVVIYLNANRLNLLIAGDETASYLGVNVLMYRTVLMCLAALVTGTVVSVSGTVGFVGLVVPHAMRLLFGPDNRVLLPAALLGGAAFLAAADCIARVVAYPVELPVGVITALTGAPFFLYLLVRR
ncbi:MAG: iron ABC transporter permease [Pseudomonadota bacterium]